ncbi:MAG: polysaccharide deacetylase family protein [Candidatus Omnitrophica bacterium]|nr:polysaccharide deacetylase family protein [Candidatus Omnitrophota bacterium]
MSGRKICGISLIVLFALISGFVVFLSKQYVVPILMYHSVNPNALAENRLAVSVESFQRQMRFLKEHRYNVLPLEELARLIKEKKKIPRRTVAITFDDGYKDNYVYAFPILKKYNLAATIFIIVDEVGRPQGDRLSWDEIIKMRDSGLISFGSHTLTHKYLTEIEDEEDLRKEIFGSKRILEEKLAQPVNLFCYPGGNFNSFIRKLVIEAGYQYAVATNPGKNYPSDDIFALKRIRISSTANNLLVFWFEISGFYTFFKEHRHK